MSSFCHQAHASSLRVSRQTSRSLKVFCGHSPLHKAPPSKTYCMETAICCLCVALSLQSVDNTRKRGRWRAREESNAGRSNPRVGDVQAGRRDSGTVANHLEEVGGPGRDTDKASR